MADAIEVALILKGVDAASSVFGGIADKLGGPFALAAGAATAAVGALGAGLGIALSEASGAQQVMAQTAAVIKSTGGAAGMTAEAVAGLANSLSQSSRFSDDAIQSGENLLLTFTNIGSDVFPGATQAMVDMAAAMGTDVAGGAVQLGKALNDPIAGVGALSRVGVQFTDDQKKVIKSLVETGDVAGAQKLILAELNKEFGGSAAAAADTFAGRMDVLKNRLLNVAEAIGGPLLTLGSSLLDQFIVPAIPAIEAMGTAFTGLLTDFLATGDLGVTIDNLREGFAGLLPPQVIDAIAAFLAALMGVSDFVVANLPAMQATAAAVFGDMQAIMTEVGAFIVTTLLPAFAEIWGQTGAELPTVQQVFDAVMAGIVLAMGIAKDFIIGTLLPALTTAVEWTVANWPAIQATIETVINAVGSVITSVMGAVQSFWAANGASIMATAAAVWGQIQANITTVITVVSAIVTAVMSALQAFWAANGASIMAIASAVWSQIQANISAVINAISGIVQAVAGGIAAFWSAWGGTIMAVASTAWSSIQTIVSTAMTVISSVISAISSAIKGDWTGFGESLRTAWNAVWEGLKAVIRNSASAMVALVGNLISSMKGVFTSTDWGAVGQAIINGVAAGIKNAAGFLADAARGAAQAALDAAKGFLGISSPSKVFMGVGMNMAKGWAQGITQGAGLIDDAVTAASRGGLSASLAGGAGSVTKTETWNITANYANQPERTLRQDIRLLQMMGSGA